MGLPKEKIPQHWIEAMEFNANLEIPVEWKPAKKATWRSGRGWYDYDRRGSHYHILLLEDFKFGRIKRKFGEFLCGAKITDRSTHEVVNLKLDLDPLMNKRFKVTCPKCLERAEKIGGMIRCSNQQLK